MDLSSSRAATMKSTTRTKTTTNSTCARDVHQRSGGKSLIVRSVRFDDEGGIRAYGERGRLRRPYLNSLSRYHSNGASMTDFCFGCLPPYAAGLSLNDRQRFLRFANAMTALLPSGAISSASNNDDVLTSWAYAVCHRTHSLSRCVRWRLR